MLAMDTPATPTSSDNVSENPFNIILFGNAGAGKSSLVNLLKNKQVAEAGNSAKAVTFQYKGYNHTIRGIPFRIYDTVGFGDGEEETPNEAAIVALYELLTRLEDGISLLIYCTKAHRATSDRTISRNWKCFHEIICKKEVPIILLITGSEETTNDQAVEATEDQWWFDSRNSDCFRKNQLRPNAVACITATKGKFQAENARFVYQSEYDKSRARVEALILRHYADPWHVPRYIWFYDVYKGTRIMGLGIWGKVTRIQAEETLNLIRRCDMPEEEANKLAELLKEADQSFEAESVSSQRTMVDNSTDKKGSKLPDLGTKLIRSIRAGTSFFTGRRPQ